LLEEIRFQTKPDCSENPFLCFGFFGEREKDCSGKREEADERRGKRSSKLFLFFK